MGLQAACAVHFLSKGSLCVALTPLNIPEQPAWAGLQLQRLSYGEPAGSSLLRAFLRLAPAEVRVWLHPAPGPFQNTTMGLHCMQDTWGSLPCVLEETLRTVIRHPHPQVSPVDMGVPSLRFFHKKMGTRVHLILSEPHGSWATSSREEVGTRAFGKGLLSTDYTLALRAC